MKKKLSFILAVCFILSSCGNKAETEEKTEASSSSEETVMTESIATTTPEATTTPATTEEISTNEEFYDRILDNSLLSTGNNSRLKNVIEKARNGEDVTIAYIGGSITEGALASPNKNCYAQKSYEAFAEMFGTGDNVHYVNAGMSGTPSCLGIVRYDGDVLEAGGTEPDILFIEFAVNDGDDVTGSVAYESMIRNALNYDKGTAVVLLFSVFRSGLWNVQERYIPLGELYGLPMVSIRNGITPEINAKTLSGDDFFAADGWHPTNYGHQLMSDCIVNMFKAIDKADNDAPISEMPAAKYGTDYEGIKMIDNNTEADGFTLTVGDFNKKDSNTGTYHFNNKAKLPDNWKHDKAAGNEPFKLEVNCKNLLLLYKYSNSSSAGSAEIYVDGELVKTLNSYKNDGWNNATTAVIFKEDTAADHVIEIKMSEDSLEKEFTILALGYTR